MSQQYDESGKGVLFINNKQGNDKRPDWKGHITLAKDYKAGDKVKLSAWTRQSKVGSLISIVENTWQPNEGGGNANPLPSKPLEDDDDIPY